MNSLKLKLIEELLEHLSGSQGNELKSMLDELKIPKDLSVQKVEIKGDPSKESLDEELKSPMSDSNSELPKVDEKEMSEDELEELLKSYC